MLVRARLVRPAGTNLRECTDPNEIGVVWYQTAEDIFAAFREGWAEDSDAQWGGETADGEEVSFTAEEMLDGIRAQGVWGFERAGAIHLWAEPEKVETTEFAHLVAHEISHAVCAHEGTLEDEIEADRYGAVAAQTIKVIGLVRAECGP